MIDRRRFVLGSLLATGGAAALAVKPWRPDRSLPFPDLDTMMPANVGSWAAGPAEAIILANPDDLGGASYDALAARHYRSATAPDVTVLIAYGRAQSYATQLHRPEFCYPASGFAIRARSRTVVPFATGSVPAQRMTARRRDRTDTLLYWARIGNSFPSGIWEQRLAIARGAIASEPQDGMLLRLSVTNPVDGSGERALNDFASAFVAAQDEKGRRLLIGRRRADPAAGLSPGDNMPQKRLSRG